MNVHDFQCGFKVFKKNSLLKIVDRVESRGWSWDTEILIRGYQKGYKIAEIPIKWVDRDESKVKLHKDIMPMLWKILKLKFSKIE